MAPLFLVLVLGGVFLFGVGLGGGLWVWLGFFFFGRGGSILSFRCSPFRS